ncbi:MAG: acyltransferase PapA5 [Syntrophorhabdus sp. PtaB.Bin184]|nr:MAG: acyltransferase PapA5 [Syntrophorhabdus sp. PtaB.Bin184]
MLCVSARIAGPLDIQLVKRACHHIWERHPSLKARIVSAEGGFSFLFNVPFNDIPIHSFFELGRTNLHTVVEREVDTLFDASKHLWRVLLITDKADLERHYLLLSLHHSISDGTSAVHLAEELLFCCTRMLAGETPRMDPLPLRASLEELLASAGRGSGEARQGAGTPPGDNRGGMLPFHEFQPPGRRHTRFRVHTLETAETAALEEKCRRTGTRVHAALAASTLSVMHRHFGDDVRLCVDTPVNVRGLTGTAIGDEELWCMETPVSIRYEDVGGRDVWRMARDYSDRLALAVSGAADLSAGTHGNPAGKIEELRAARHFPLSCLLREGGRVEPGQKGPFVIENMGLVSGRQAAEYMMVISTATVGEVLALTFSYTSLLLKESWADRFVSEFLHNLERMAK